MAKPKISTSQVNAAKLAAFGRRRRIVKDPDYMPGEDPLAGVMLLWSWLQGVTGRWRGLSDIADERIDTTASIETLLDVLELSPEEKRVLIMQAQGARHVAICAETGWTPRQVERRVAGINRKVRAWAEARRLQPPVPLPEKKFSDEGGEKG